MLSAGRNFQPGIYMSDCDTNGRRISEKRDETMLIKVGDKERLLVELKKQEPLGLRAF